jgi:hypothetical protein
MIITIGRAGQPTAGGALPVRANADEHKKLALTAEKSWTNRMAIPNGYREKPKIMKKDTKILSPSTSSCPRYRALMSRSQIGGGC